MSRDRAAYALGLGLLMQLAVGCSAGYKQFECGSSSIVVLRDPARAFPVYAKTFQVQFALTQANKDSLKKATANTTVGTQVVALYDTLDVINADVRNFLVSAYDRYVVEMCAGGGDPERAKLAGQSFDAAQRAILDYALRVREIAAALDRARAQKSDLDEAFNLARGLRDQLGGQTSN